MVTKKRACANCTLAKTKCIWEPPGRCERCLRLNKVCSEKMDEEVLARKKERKGWRVNKRAGTNPLSPSSAPVQLTNQSKLPVTHSNVISGNNKHDVWLERYRNQMAEHFPFVIVPNDISAAELGIQQPLLFNAIMMAACDEPSEQVSRAKQLRTDIAQKTIIEAEKSLDILQAILVAIAWYHVHLDISLILSNLVAIGTAILTDLRWDTHPQQIDRRKTEFATREAPLFYTKSGSKRSLQERRTFLGFCYASTFIYITCERIQYIKSISYQDQCIESLELANEYPTDHYLLYLSRLTKLAQTMSLSLDMEEFLPTIKPTQQDWDVIQVLKDEFSAIRGTQFDTSLTISQSAAVHTQIVEMYFEELACQMNWRQQLPLSRANDPQSEKILEDCYELAKGILKQGQNCVRGPPSSWTYLEMVHVTHAIVILLKTTAIKHGLPKSHMNDKTLVEHSLQEIELKLFNAAIDHASTVSGTHNIYHRAARQIRVLRERYLSSGVPDSIDQQAAPLHSASNSDFLQAGPENIFRQWFPNDYMMHDVFLSTDLGIPQSRQL